MYSIELIFFIYFQFTYARFVSYLGNQKSSISDYNIISKFISLFTLALIIIYQSDLIGFIISKSTEIYTEEQIIAITDCLNQLIKSFELLLLLFVFAHQFKCSQSSDELEQYEEDHLATIDKSGKPSMVKAEMDAENSGGKKMHELQNVKTEMSTSHGVRLIDPENNFN